MLAHGEAKVFVVPKQFNKFDHEDMADGLKPSLPHLDQIVVLDGSGLNTYDALLCNPAFDGERGSLTQDSRLRANDVIELMYTSGTTGEPKGAMQTPNTIIANLVPVVERLEMDAQDVILMASPVAHQTGFAYGLILPMMLGARMVLMDKWDKTLAAELVEKEGVTWTMASTPFLIDLTNAVEEGGTVSSTLRIFFCSGTVIPGAVVERAQNVLGARVISTWGMTEIGAITTVRLDDPDDQSAVSDGCPLPGAELQIRDADGTPVGANTG